MHLWFFLQPGPLFGTPIYATSSRQPPAPQAVRTPEDMERLFRVAQHRSSNWGLGHSPEGLTHPTPEGPQRSLDPSRVPHAVPLPNRAHLFLRLSVFDRSRRSLSSLHVVDLVGLRAPPGPLSPPRDPLSRPEIESRAAARDLHSLSRMILDFSRRADPEAGDVMAPRMVPSAKDCKLTRAVAPLLGGNSRAWVLCTASPYAEDRLQTMDTLRVAARAAAIRTACMGTSGVAEESLVLAEMRDVEPGETILLLEMGNGRAR